MDDTTRSSTFQPGLPTELSDPMRNFSLTGWRAAAGGRVKLVVKNARIPDHAERPLIRITETSADHAVVAAGQKGATRGKNVLERSAVDGNLEDPTVKGVFQIVVVLKRHRGSVVRGEGRSHDLLVGEPRGENEISSSRRPEAAREKAQGSAAGSARRGRRPRDSGRASPF